MPTPPRSQLSSVSGIAVDSGTGREHGDRVERAIQDARLDPHHERPQHPVHGINCMSAGGESKPVAA